MLRYSETTTISLKDVPHIMLTSAGILIYRSILVNVVLWRLGQYFKVKNLVKFTNRLYDLIH